MFPKKEPLVELKALRMSSDPNHNGLPLQQRFFRFYKKGKEFFKLERDNSGQAREGEVGLAHAGFLFFKILKDGEHVVKFDGHAQWGEAFSWAGAERAIMELLDCSCIQRDRETEDLKVAVSGR